MATDRVRDQQGSAAQPSAEANADDMVDDLAEHLSFALDDIDEHLARLIDDYAVDRPRGADILRLRLGIGDQGPETLTRIGARFDFSRDRIRQLHTKAVGELLRQAKLTGELPADEFAQRYPTTAKDQQLVRALLTETYVTATDLVANELSYLKLRLAGHDAADAKRVSGFVAQRLAAWRKKTNHRLARLHDGAPFPVGHDHAWLDHIDWPPDATSPAPLPTDSARTLDGDDDGRGRFYLDKVGRDVGCDSGLDARLLGVLNADEQISTFQENPDAVLYRVDGEDGVHFPTAAARLADGRVALIDVQPLGRIAYRDYRARAAAARSYAHDNGWGWLVWTGSAVGVPEVAERRVDAALETRLTELVEQGGASWAALRQLRADTGLTPLDLAAAVLRHDWSWDRGTHRISASPVSPS
ncbi:sigma factor-like helix-turn-helix DNA-binding protein [Nocardia cyriacigeorgica]|uniref:sigma factor-like helix-turn-helix DNA-binding protein n=1 Tax=Nocardia cyriacigeorgica TaxID=135487 RepID=UPI0028037A63|nr:sigma factor-like helix-turn-helix DNA-binding protein [Nocardia cyriacigeorgica]